MKRPIPRNREVELREHALAHPGEAPAFLIDLLDKARSATKKERLVNSCYDCPFAQKREWRNEDSDSGIDYEGCDLLPKITREEINQLGYYEARPTFCPLNTEPVLVKARPA